VHQILQKFQNFDQIKRHFWCHLATFFRSKWQVKHNHSTHSWTYKTAFNLVQWKPGQVTYWNNSNEPGPNIKLFFSQISCSSGNHIHLQNYISGWEYQHVRLLKTMHADLVHYQLQNSWLVMIKHSGFRRAFVTIQTKRLSAAVCSCQVRLQIM